MKSKSLKGFSVVYRQNLRINMKNAKYVIATVAVALILLIGFGAVVFFVTKSDKEDDKYSYDVEKIYVADETGLGIADYGMIAPMLGFGYVGDTEFVAVTGDARELMKRGDISYLLVQTKNDEGDYLIKIIAGKDVDTGDKQVKKNLSLIEEFSSPCLKNYVYMTSGLTVEQVIQVLLTVDASTEEIGELIEEEDESKFLTQIILTTVITFIVYFSITIYGVAICSDVPMEKTSKLVEQLLMAVTSTALISGKILAMITACLIQFTIWFASIFAGIIGGDALVRNVYDIDKSIVSTALDYIEKWFEGQGFTAIGITLAIILFLVGIMVYLILAGLSGAMLTKPENAGNVQGVFMLPLIISYFVILIIIGTGSEFNIPIALNLIPFTSAMTAPAGALLGTLSVPMAFLSLLVSVLFCALELFLAAKIYEGLLFFNGNKLKFKDIIAVFKK